AVFCTNGLNSMEVTYKDTQAVWDHFKGTDKHRLRRVGVEVLRYSHQLVYFCSILKRYLFSLQVYWIFWGLCPRVLESFNTIVKIIYLTRQNMADRARNALMHHFQTSLRAYTDLRYGLGYRAPFATERLPTMQLDSRVFCLRLVRDGASNGVLAALIKRRQKPRREANTEV
ncbi:hypothetical protein PC122_g25146, partial [Phytophthora cactorum]